MNKKVDYLIVGQGLAGSILALQLMQRNKTFHIYDPQLTNSSTMVAAGLINPLVLKRLTLSWKAKSFIDYNNNFYPEMEKVLGKKFYHPMPLYKLIISDDEKHFWKHRFKKDKIASFLEKTLYPVSENIAPTKKYKVGRVKKTAWLDTTTFILEMRKKLIAEEKLTEKKIDYKKLMQNNYENIIFKNIIFCEGAAAQNNPYLKDFPLKGNKGNLIRIRSKEFYSKNIIKKKVFVLPIGQNEYKIGATYSLNFKNEAPDKASKKLLQEQFEEISKANYDIINHEAGIRPTVEDRRPLLGAIKSRANYYVFNGLGSRGCMMAPLLANHLLDFIENQKPLAAECNIERFYT